MRVEAKDIAWFTFCLVVLDSKISDYILFIVFFVLEIITYMMSEKLAALFFWKGFLGQKNKNHKCMQHLLDRESWNFQIHGNILITC